MEVFRIIQVSDYGGSIVHNFRIINDCNVF